MMPARSTSPTAYVGQAPIIGTADPGSAEWHELRRGGIGGSEVAAVLGLSPWAGPHRVWLEKHDLITDDEASIRMRVGQRLEELVIELLGELSPFTRARPYPVTITHPDHEWWRVNLDGIVVDSNEIILIEAKAPDGHQWTPWHEEGVPLHYICQVQYALGATGLQRAVVPALFGNDRFDWWVIERDEEDIATIAEHVGAFWERCIVGGEPPDIDASEDCRAWLVNRYGEGDERAVPVDLDADADRWVRAMRRAKEVTDKAALVKREAQNRLLAAIGDARVGTTPAGERVTVVRTRRFDEALCLREHRDSLHEFMTALDADALRRAEPQIYDACRTRVSMYPRIKGLKEGNHG